MVYFKQCAEDLPKLAKYYVEEDGHYSCRIRHEDDPVDPPDYGLSNTDEEESIASNVIHDIITWDPAPDKNRHQAKVEVANQQPPPLEETNLAFLKRRI